MPLGPFDTQNYLQIGQPPAQEPIGSFRGGQSPPMEDKELLLSQLFQGGGGVSGAPGSAGQPVGGGKKGFMGGAGIAIGAPIVALLASKLSGGSMGMSEALASIGGGFLNKKLEDQKTKKLQGLEQENKMMDLAHKSVQGLSKFTPETLAKFPQLSALSQKYQDALANDGIISPKEAAEIVTQYQLAQADMALATKDQDTASGLADRAAQFEQGRALQSEGQWKTAAEGMPDADGVSLEEKMGLAKEMAFDDAQLSRDNQGLAAVREERALRRQEATERHQRVMEELRERQISKQGANLGRQESIASFQSDMAEWQQALSTALAGVDDDPELKQQILQDFRGMMPRKDSYVRGGGPSKLDRSTLDSVIQRHVPSAAPPPAAAPTQIKFGGKIYNSFDELPPEGQAKYLAKTGGKR
jgi:hypothetical protein